MTVKELANYFNLNPTDLSCYVEKKYGILIPPIEEKQIDDYILNKISPNLLRQENAKQSRNYKKQLESEKLNKKAELLVQNIIHGKINDAIDTINNATDVEIEKYEEKLAQFVLRYKPTKLIIWEQVIKLEEIEWTLFRMTLYRLKEKKEYAQWLVKEHNIILSRLLEIYLERCDSTEDIMKMICSLKSIIDYTFTDAISKIIDKIHDIEDYDKIIDAMQLNWQQMIDFLIKCNNKTGLYILGRNLLNDKTRSIYKWKNPSNTEIRKISNRIIAECTIYPEIQYIHDALIDVTNNNNDNVASDSLELNNYKAFWKNFYKLRDQDIDSLKKDASIQDSYIVKVENLISANHLTLVL